MAEDVVQGVFGDAPEDETWLLDQQQAAELGEIEEADSEAPASDVPVEGEADSPQPPPPQQQSRPIPSVPLPEVQELRRKLAEREREAAEYRERWARFEERFRIAQEEAERQRQLALQQQDPPPDPNEDPDGYREWKLRQLEAQQQAQEQMLRSAAAQFQQALLQQQQFVQAKAVLDEVNLEQIRFAQQHPDYYHAIGYLEQWHRNECAALGLDEATTQQLLDQRKVLLMANAKKQGRNAAQVAYGLALQAGWHPSMAMAPQGQASTADAQAAGAQAQQRASVIPQQYQQPPRKVQMAQAGVEAASRQAGGGRPATPGGRITLKDLVEMDPEEFAEFQRTHPQLVRELMS